MAHQSRMTAQVARWGMLLSSLVLGIALVSSSLLGFFSASDAARSVARIRAMDMLTVARRELGAAGFGEIQMESLLAEMRPQGLRTIAGLGPAGEPTFMTGDPLGALPPLGRFSPGAGPVVVHDWGPDRVLAAGPLVAGRGRSSPGRGRGIGRGRQALPDMQRTMLVIVFEPVAAGAMVGRARWTLGLSLAVAFLALVGSMVFFRLSRRAEWYRVELEKKKKLAALGEMSAVLGHEIRNPLASLKGHAQLVVERAGSDSPVRKSAEQVVEEAKRLERLTNEILDFVRTGKLDPKTAQPIAVAQAAIAELGTDEIKLEAHNPVPDWPLDTERMQQVLTNLLANAIEASPPGEQVVLTIRHAEGVLEYRVRDFGDGIEPAEIGQVFKPFFTGRVRGTGLGLAVAELTSDVVQRIQQTLRKRILTIANQVPQ